MSYTVTSLLVTLHCTAYHVVCVILSLLVYKIDGENNYKSRV